MQAEVATSDDEEQEYVDAVKPEYWTSDVEEQQRYIDALNADNWLRAINHVGRQTLQLRNAHAQALSQQATSPSLVSQHDPDAISQRPSSPPLEFPSSPPDYHPQTTPSSNSDPFDLPLSAAPSYPSPHPQSDMYQLWSRHSSLSPLSHRSLSQEPQRQLSLEIPSSSPAPPLREPTPSLAHPPPPPSPPPVPNIPPAHDPPPVPEEPTSRYSLRQRKAIQLNPFLLDRINYKQTLRHNPDAIVHRAELRGKTPEESQDAGHGESQQDAEVDEDEDMQDAYLSPRKRRRIVNDDLPGDDIDRPRHHAGGGSAYKRIKSFRKHPRDFPLPTPSHPSSSNRPPPTSSSPPLSPRSTPIKKWEPAAYAPESDDDLEPLLLSSPAPARRRANNFPVLHSPPRHESPMPVSLNEDDGLEEDGEDDDEAGFDARSDDVISLTDHSSPPPGSDRSLSEEIEVFAPRRPKRIRPHDARPPRRTKQTRLAPIFTHPGRQPGGNSGVKVKLTHTTRPQAAPSTKRTKTVPKTSISRRQPQLRTTHADRQEHQATRRVRRGRAPAPIEVEVYAPPARFAREKRPYATVDLEDDGIRRALAPLQLPTVNRAVPAPAPAASKPSSRVMMRTLSTRSFARTSSVRTFSRTASVATSINLDNYERAHSPERHHTHGMHASSGPSHILRAEEVKPPRAAHQLKDYFIQHGWLRELLGVIAGAVPRPHRTEVLTHRLSPFSSASDVGDAVRFLCAATNVPCVQLELATHNVVTHIAWSCNPARPDAVPEADVRRLWEVVYNCSENMVTRVVDSSEFGSLGTRDVLCAHWISLELSLAFMPAPQLSDAREPTIMKRINALITRLVVAGIDDALRILAPAQDVDAPESLSSLLLSLWIRAIYICSRRALPLSTFICEAVSETVGSSPSLKRSELIWTLIYGLETLSRFNASGVYITTSMLQPLWPLVSLALHSIRLDWVPGADDGLDEEVLLKRDDHLRLIVRRCWILHHRREWALDPNGSRVIEQLAAIFRTRKFANLLHESCALPAFVLHHDPTALFHSDEDETAFVTWLKLLAAVVCGSTPATQTAVRKLLAAVLPVGSVSIEDPAAPTDREMSMICNRLAIGPALLAMHVKGTNPASRRSLSSTYNLVSFIACGESSRAVIIDAVFCMGSFEQHLEGASWDDLTKWGVLVIRVLRQEWEHSASPSERVNCSSSGRLLSRLLADVKMLMKSAIEREDELWPFVQRHDKSGHALPGQFLFEVLDLPLDLLSVGAIADSTSQLITTCIAFCSEHLPVRRPRVPKEESQDEYVDYYDSIPEVELAKIDALNERTVKDKARDVIQHIAAEVVPALHRIMCEFSLELGQAPSLAQSAWLAVWLEAVVASVRYHDPDWSIYMGNTVLSPSRIADAPWRGYVESKLLYRSENLV